MSLTVGGTHMNGFTWRLVLKQTEKATWNWPILYSPPNCYFLLHVTCFSQFTECVNFSRKRSCAWIFWGRSGYKHGCRISFNFQNRPPTPQKSNCLSLKDYQCDWKVPLPDTTKIIMIIETVTLTEMNEKAFSMKLLRSCAINKNLG